MSDISGSLLNLRSKHEELSNKIRFDQTLLEGNNVYVKKESGVLVPTTVWREFRRGYLSIYTDAFLRLAELSRVALEKDRRLTHFMTRTMLEMVVNQAIFSNSTSVDQEEYTDFYILKDVYLGHLMNPSTELLGRLYRAGKSNYMKKKYTWLNLFDDTQDGYKNTFINNKQQVLFNTQSKMSTPARDFVMENPNTPGSRESRAKIKTALFVIPSMVLHGNYGAISMVTGDYSNLREEVLCWLIDRFSTYTDELIAVNQ